MKELFRRVDHRFLWSAGMGPRPTNGDEKRLVGQAILPALGRLFFNGVDIAGRRRMAYVPHIDRNEKLPCRGADAPSALRPPGRPLCPVRARFFESPSREAVSPASAACAHERNRMMPVLRIALLAVAVISLSCGYHVAGKTTLLPTTVQTIAIPAFSNATTVYKLTDQLTEAVTREFISRTKYHITTDPGSADATLRGWVNTVVNFPTVYDPVTFRAANVEVHVNMRLQLVDRSGKVLFDRPTMEARERYEVSVDPIVYFDESEVAMRRLARDVAKTIVSAILENF